jgi:hypothetical protein
MSSRSTISLSYGGRRRHVAVIRAGRVGSALEPGWYLQEAWPTPHGYRLDHPHAGPFRTRREAVLAKREAAR